MSGDRELVPFENDEFLKRWAAKREECLTSEDDEEKRLEKRRQYDLWRYGYPENDARKSSEEIRLEQEAEQIEKRLLEIRMKLASRKAVSGSEDLHTIT